MFDSKKMKLLLKKSAEKLNGKWLLIGGTVLPALGVDYRATIDVDLIPLNAQSNDDLISLMELAEDLSLPIEAINSAGAYFLKKIGSYENDMVLLLKGSMAEIYRPNFYLFFQLKIARLSEQDFLDILEMRKYCLAHSEDLKLTLCQKILTQELKKSLPQPHKERLESLKELLGK